MSQLQTTNCFRNDLVQECSWSQTNTVRDDQMPILIRLLSFLASSAVKLDMLPIAVGVLNKWKAIAANDEGTSERGGTLEQACLQLCQETMMPALVLDVDTLTEQKKHEPDKMIS